ncbi:hypothetical protein F5888DRAFT_1806026 [Russula emetica]|nr:hypothetical protein F5888DRAFT_1806026 [Russula emetica]
MTPFTLPNLRWFGFRAVRRITTPRLEKLDLDFFKYPTVSIPSLRQVRVLQRPGSYDVLSPQGRQAARPSISVDWWYLDWQVSSVVRNLNLPSKKFSAVVHLTLEHRNNMQSVEVHMEIGREWSKIFRTFSNLKTLRVDDEVDDGGHPVEVLPELQELTYPRAGSGNARDVFISFIDARQNIGRPGKF